MDKIWDRKSFEVGSHWPFLGDEKNESPRRTDKKLNAKKHTQKNHSMQLQISDNPLYFSFSFWQYRVTSDIEWNSYTTHQSILER